MVETIFVNSIFMDYILPFLLIFVVTFAVLEKTKVFGDSNKQLNAILALVVGLIFVGFIRPKEITTNLILFLSVALVIILVFLLLYGFFAGDQKFIDIGGKMKWVIAAVVFIAVIIAVVWASGGGNTSGDLYNTVFGQSWSKPFWTNLLFLVVIAVVVSVVVLSGKDK